MTHFRPYWFSFPHLIEGKICNRILRIFWNYLTDNESVFILSTNWVWVKCRKGGFQIEKRVACWGRVQCRLNLSLLELQFSFSEWLTDNSWKENDVFRAAKQALQIKVSAWTSRFLVCLKSCIVVNPPTKQLNIENQHKHIKRVEINSF